MSTDRIVVVARSGALSLAEGDDSRWTSDGHMYERPITLAELAREWPRLYDALLIALRRYKDDPKPGYMNWVQFKE